MALGEVNQPINYGQPVNYLQDALLSGQTQAAMQQKYDVNTAKIEGMVEQISAIPIQQQAGKKYLMDKLQGVLNTVSANMKVSGGFGILSNSYTGGITSQIKGAIDDKVKKHIKYSADIINFEKGVAKLREKDPKLYNQANYDFAQYKAGLQNYLQGDENADLGSLQYKPYKDVFGDATKKAKDLKDLKGDQEIDIPDGNGGMTRRKLSGLKPEEVLNYMPNLIDSQDEQQLMIDGWSDMRGMKPEQIAERFDTFVNTKKTNVEGEISRISNILKTEKDTLSKEKKDNYNSLLKTYKNTLSDINTTSSEINKTSPEQVGYIFKKEQFKSTAVDMFSGRISETRMVDPIEKENRDYQISLEKLAIDKANLALNEAKAKKELGIEKTQDGTYSDTSGVYKSPVSDQKVDDPKAYVKQYEEEYTNLYNTVYRGAKDLYNEVTTDDSYKKEFEESMKKNGFMLNKTKDDFVADPNYKGNRPSRAEAMSAALVDSDMNEIAPNEVANIFEAEGTRKQYSDALTEANSKGKSKEPPVYKKVVTNQFAVAKGGDAPIYEDVLVSGKPDDYNTIKKVLESKGLRPNVSNQGQFTFAAKTYKSMLESIPANEIKGGAFDLEKTFTVEQTTSGKFKVTQVLQGTDKNPQKIITAELSGESALAGQLGNIIETKTDVQKGISTKNVPKGYTITSPLVKSTMINRSNEPRKEDILDNVGKVITDKSLVNNILNFSTDATAKTIIANNLKLKGIDENYANNFTNKLIKLAQEGKLKGEIKSGVNKWGFTAKLNGEVVNRYFAIGGGDTLNRDIKKGLEMYPTQMVLYQLNNYLMSANATKEEIEEINQLINK